MSQRCIVVPAGRRVGGGSGATTASSWLRTRREACEATWQEAVVGNTGRRRQGLRGARACSPAVTRHEQQREGPQGKGRTQPESELGSLDPHRVPAASGRPNLLAENLEGIETTGNSLKGDSAKV